MDHEKIVYEVWNFAGSGSPRFVSDDPVEVVIWLRSHPVGKRYFNVHPRGPGFLRNKMIEYDFISKHREEAIDRMIRDAIQSGKSEGVAREIINLMSGR